MLSPGTSRGWDNVDKIAIYVDNLWNFDKSFRGICWRKNIQKDCEDMWSAQDKQRYEKSHTEPRRYRKVPVHSWHEMYGILHTVVSWDE